MKTILLFIALFVSAAVWASAQKNCANDSTGLIPLLDLAGASWRGYRGGLYPDGTNNRPQLHKNKALLQAQNVQPLDANGAVSSTGKIVWIGVGASNPRTEFLRFSAQMDTFALRNPALKLINTCIGGQGIQKMNNVDDNYWKQAEKQLQDSSLTNKQVQIAWIETDNTQVADTTFPRAPQLLGDDFKLLLATMKQLYPNLKLCYLTARAYSGYAEPNAGESVGKGLLFPRDYLNGWAIKWLIEKQINDESGYGFEGMSAPLPFITWGTYNWADGSVKRSDGLQWLCDTDIGGDGLHLSEAGEKKSGALMFEYFIKDESTQSWILKKNISSVEENSNPSKELSVFPNPACTTIYVENTDNILLDYHLLDITGRKVATGTTAGKIPIDQLPQGVYWLLLENGSRAFVAVER